MTSENVKQGLKEALASDVDSKRALALGIYARMVYLMIAVGPAQHVEHKHRQVSPNCGV